MFMEEKYGKININTIINLHAVDIIGMSKKNIKGFFQILDKNLHPSK